MSDAFEPTEDHRKIVRTMTAYGIPQASISKVIGCSVPTLYKYFQYEIDTAAVAATTKIAQTLFNIATDPKGGKEAVTACIFWLKCRGHWREVEPDIGKKEQTILNASTATQGTDWGDLLQFETEDRPN